VGFIRVGEQRRRIRAIECSSENCQRRDEIFDNGSTELPNEIVLKKFQQKNWEVGRDRNNDVCPDCLASRRHRKQREEKMHDRNSVVAGAMDRLQTLAQQKPSYETAQAAIVAARHPEKVTKAAVPEVETRKMEVDERRVVFTKLNDVWAGGDMGYAAPWTDAAVAKDLGVPLAWVVEVRSLMFGEIRDNQDIRDILDKITQTRQDITDNLLVAVGMTKQMAEMATQAKELHNKIKELQRTADGLYAIATRIEASTR